MMRKHLNSSWLCFLILLSISCASDKGNPALLEEAVPEEPALDREIAAEAETPESAPFADSAEEAVVDRPNSNAQAVAAEEPALDRELASEAETPVIEPFADPAEEAVVDRSNSNTQAAAAEEPALDREIASEAETPVIAPFAAPADEAVVDRPNGNTQAVAAEEPALGQGNSQRSGPPRISAVCRTHSSRRSRSGQIKQQYTSCRSGRTGIGQRASQRSGNTRD